MYISKGLGFCSARKLVVKFMKVFIFLIGLRSIEHIHTHAIRNSMYLFYKWLQEYYMFTLENLKMPKI